MLDREKLLENIPDVPKKGTLRRLILQLPEENFIEKFFRAVVKNDIPIPEEFWALIFKTVHS